MDVYKTHGAFSWSELSTGDTKKALSFYGKLFGWASEPMDMGPNGTYNVIKVGDTSIGGISAKPEGMEKMPAMWGCYVTVDDIDQTAKDCARLGGKVCMGPMDIPEVGRMAVLQDPEGAMINAITYKMGG